MKSNEQLWWEVYGKDYDDMRQQLVSKGLTQEEVEEELISWFGHPNDRVILDDTGSPVRISFHTINHA